MLPGITTLTTRLHDWIAGRRVGLVSHPAALDGQGRSSAACLASCGHGVRLAAIFGPEHGFFGQVPAGKRVATRRHPLWGIPVHSLYGTSRKPSPSMLRGIETIVVDFQDLAVRCYTYVSTLRLVMEAAAEAGLPVIVADRPVPLPCTVDGPLLDPACESFVGLVPSPFVYGMTPGETALWLREALGLDLDLRVAAMEGYSRDPARGSDWPPWIAPSPAIVSWESATCYAATVFGEAIPSVNCGRHTSLPFQLFGATWLDGARMCDDLNIHNLAGVRFDPHPYPLPAALGAQRIITGVRISVTDRNAFAPATAGVHILSAIARRHGSRRLWQCTGVRPEFFDKLFGSASVRTQLLAGKDPAEIVAAWAPECAGFRAARNNHLLYASA